MNKMQLTILAAVAGLTAFAGGYGASTVLIDRPQMVAPAAALPIAMIVPVWGQGHITGFVAVEISLELTPGSNGAPLLPLVRDRLLGDLYDIGAQGGMQPGIIDPPALQARLLHAAGEVTGGNIRKLTLTKLILQENRRKPA